LVVRLFDTRDFDAQRLPNASPLYDPYAPGNKNVLIITPEKRAFAYRGTTLAAVALRLLGILPGCVTVWLAFGIAHLATGDRRVAAVAMALTAFNPMFLTVTTAVSNDGLLITLTTAALYVLMQALAQGVTLQRAFVFGVLAGLASLAKLSGALLLPLASAMLVAPRPEHGAATSRPHWSKLIAAVAMLWLLIAGWWYIRNVLLYGEPTGTAMMAAIAHPRRISFLEALAEFEGLRLSYLAVFGHFNVPADGLAYQAFDIFLLACLAGLILHLARRRRSMSAAYWLRVGALAAYPMLTYAALVRWTMMTPASQGRLLFPAIAALSTLMALGLVELAQTTFIIRRHHVAPFAALPAASCIGLFILAAISPFRYVIPAYMPPLVDDLPEGMTPARQRFDAFAEVVGYGVQPQAVYPGDKVRVSVVMRARQPTAFDYLLVVSLLGRDNRPLARFDTFTGGGLLPSSQWRADQMWRDDVDLIVPEDAEAPATLRVQFALYDRGSGDIIPSYDDQGNPGAPVFDGATLLPVASSDKADNSAWIAALGDIGLLQAARFAPSATAGQPLTVTLTWRTLRPTRDAYTTFVHLVDERGTLRAQGDAPPLDGQFPTTRWRAGVTFDDSYPVLLPAELPPGRYRLFVGLYHAADLTRLPAFDRGGKRLPDDSIYLGEVRVVPPT
ncbi:MAG: phospholipid carrier-dependent glycosyltransferase, partial [Chloroflexi bacterium]